MLYNLWKILLAVFIFTKCLDAAQILVVPARDTGSHLASMIDYILLQVGILNLNTIFFRLAERGHSVHLLDSAFATPKYFHPNLTTISVFAEMESSSFEPWTSKLVLIFFALLLILNLYSEMLYFKIFIVVVGNDPRRLGGSENQKDMAFAKMLELHGEKVRIVLNHLVIFYALVRSNNVNGLGLNCCGFVL